MWGEVIFQVAATQLGSISSPCKPVEEVMFRAESLKSGRAAQSKDCKLIDEALAGDNFPSLRRVRLYKDIPFDWFPILQSRGILESMNS